MLRYVVTDIAKPEAPTERYVTPTADGTGNGTVESSAWTFQQAVGNAAPGMTIWLKAGDYGDLHLTMGSSGTAESPIKLIGYRSTPGDVTSLYYTYAKGVGLDVSQLPTLSGASTGIGINLQSDYVILRNLQLRHYDRALINEQGGVTGGVEGNIIERVVAHTNSSYAENNGNLIGFKGMTSRRNRVLHSVAVNTTMLAISMRGYHSLIDGCKAYADELVNSSDYYIDTKGSDNIVRRSLAHRTGANSHNGHGLVIKGRAADNSETYVWDSQHTLIEDCDVINIQQAVQLSHKETQHNVVRDVRVTNPDNYSSVKGVVFYNSSHNIVEQLRYDSNTGEALTFGATSEDKASVNGAHHNVVRNSVFSRGSVVVRVTPDGDSAQDRDIFANEIHHCTFVGFGYVEDNDATREHTDNRVTHSILDGCGTYAANGGNPTQLSFEHSAFNGIGFAPPSGTGNVEAAPQFVDLVSFVPQNEALKVGPMVPGLHYDFFASERGEPTTLGAVVVASE